MNMNISRVREAQAPLRKHYRIDPSAALVTDHATTRRTNGSDPFHTDVSPMPECGVSLPVGVHGALGGLHDAPTPGDLLCAAWASCMDSSLRMVANAMGITLLSLEVEVEGDVDVRGTLMMEPDVPVGFQRMVCKVKLGPTPDTPSDVIDNLCRLAERCCVIQQTLLHTPQLQTRYECSPCASATNDV